jgi:hypothetical protein
MRELRRPGQVPAGPDVTGGHDTDLDGRPDTTVTSDGEDLVLATDLDGDGFADQILRIGADGVVREAVLEFPAVDRPGEVIIEGMSGGAELGSH